MVNLTLDEEEEFDKLCTSCKDKSKIKKCPGCGNNKEQDINPEFDDDMFNKMKENL